MANIQGLSSMFNMGSPPSGPAQQPNPENAQGGVNPAAIEMIVSGVQAMRDLGFDDQKIVQIIGEAAVLESMAIQEEQIAQLVAQVPKEAPQNQVPPGGPAGPPQGNIPMQGV